MRLRHETPARLVLEDRPWIMGIGLALGVLAFAAAGLFTVLAEPLLGLAMFGGMALFGLLFAVFVRRTIAVFDRAGGAVVVRSTSVFGTAETALPLARILGVTVQTSLSSGTDGGPSTRTHRAVLLVEGGDPLPLTRVYSSGPGAARAAAAIERWLAAGG